MDKVKRRKFFREWREKLKVEVFTHYSDGFPKCAFCGYNDMRALVIDHINDDGARHRKRLSGRSYGDQAGGSRTYQYLKSHNYPSGFQVLCANCNTIKEYVRRKSLVNN